MQFDWRSILRTNLTNIDEVASFLELTADQRHLLAKRSDFVVNIPRRLAEKMTKGSLEDPLFRQFVPLDEERLASPLFICDPVGDAHFRKTPKLLHKYHGRALIVTTGACAMHCRYCFRQNYDYMTEKKSFQKELDSIRADNSIKEIILSGGDPLSLPDHRLQELLDGLALIPHIQRVRFHSRFPVGIPERITDSFLSMLQSYRFTYWFVCHVNHVRELDSDVLHAFKRLILAGIPVLNQSVLLKGVNDTVDAQVTLCETLVNHGIHPYYLHQLDRVQGTKHFEVEEEEGHRLIREMMKCLPGYAVPKYVKEICGEPNKTIL